jgi:hypothetical protein
MNAQIAAMLKNFDLNNLNEFWKKEYNHFSKQSSKENSLQILINAVEGDYSQLNPKLAEIAELQDALKETTRNIKKFIKEVFVRENTEVYLEENELLEIMKGYLDAAIWTEEERLQSEYQPDLDSNEEDSDLNKLIRIQADLNKKPFENFITEDLEPDSKIQAYMDIKNFIKIAGPQAISETLDTNNASQLGHDIWLTRNRHGAGFFDHNYDFEKQLMDAAHAIKEVDLYITDNATLAFSNAH